MCVLGEVLSYFGSSPNVFSWVWNFVVCMWICSVICVRNYMTAPHQWCGIVISFLTQTRLHYEECFHLWKKNTMKFHFSSSTYVVKHRTRTSQGSSIKKNSLNLHCKLAFSGVNYLILKVNQAILLLELNRIDKLLKCYHQWPIILCWHILIWAWNLHISNI